jgi:hypothetical protein
VSGLRGSAVIGGRHADRLNYYLSKTDVIVEFLFCTGVRSTKIPRDTLVT